MLRPVLSGEVHVINIYPKYLQQVSSSDYISIRLIKEGGFPGGSVGKESTLNARDTGNAVLISGSGRSSWRRA